jgi:hypothetical protein
MVGKKYARVASIRTRYQRADDSKSRIESLASVLMHYANRIRPSTAHDDERAVGNHQASNGVAEVFAFPNDATMQQLGNAAPELLRSIHVLVGLQTPT